MNKESRPLTQEQRKEFVQLLKDARDRITETLATNRWKLQEKAKDVARQSLLERIGAAELAKKWKEAKKILKESEQALEKLGVYFDSGSKIRFSGSHEDEYDTEIDEKASEILDGQKEESRKTYEKAILNVLATESVEEAKGIVEPLV
jgi:ClpP class serine protease